MGEDWGAVGAEFATPILLLVRHATPIKPEDKVLRKYLKERDENRAKYYPGMHEIAPFFRNSPPPHTHTHLQRS